MPLRTIKLTVVQLGVLKPFQASFVTATGITALRAPSEVDNRDLPLVYSLPSTALAISLPMHRLDPGPHSYPLVANLSTSPFFTPPSFATAFGGVDVTAIAVSVSDLLAVLNLFVLVLFCWAQRPSPGYYRDT